jgi:hypothetical protein
MDIFADKLNGNCKQYKKSMENSKSLFWNQAMRWGLYVSVALIIISLVFYFMGKSGHNAEGWFQYLIAIAGIIMATGTFRKKLPEKAPFSYGNALGFGVSVMLFSSIVVAVYTYVMYQFISPELMDKLLIETEEAYLKSGLSEDMVEQQVNLLKNFMSPGLLAFSQIFNWVFTGLIISLITSIFLMKKSQGGFEGAMSELDEDK